LGYLFLAFPIAAGSDRPGVVWTGCLVFLLSHATAKAALFLAAGNMARAAGHDRIADLSRFMKALPISVFTMGIAAISLIGLPPSAGFLGKWLLLGVSLDQGQWWWVVVIVGGSLFTVSYMMRVLAPAFSDEQSLQPVGTVTRGMTWSAMILALLSLALGFVGTVPARLLQGLLQGGGGA
jgi:formate hydrogenlyase subunit 3/multisubunit Na+/H+ antiporter MnhD subunit